LQIPKLRKGSYFPSLLQPRRRAEKALLNVVQEAYVHGVSTRKVDELVESLGIGGISKSEVSRICKELDEVVQAFKNRPLEGEFPYVWLDATFPKVREGGRVQSMAFVIAIGVKATGEREVLGFDLGTSEDGSFWLTFLRSLVARGLKGVKLAISDAHEGLRAAIATTLVGATWQRCRVHVMRNVLSQVPKSSQAMVSSIVRTIFAQPTQEAAKEQLALVVNQLKSRFPKAMDVLQQAEEDVLAYMAFPREHWRQICSTNPLERLNREIRRRMDVVGIFPNRDSVIRLVGTFCKSRTRNGVLDVATSAWSRWPRSRVTRHYWPRLRFCINDAAHVVEALDEIPPLDGTLPVSQQPSSIFTMVHNGEHVFYRLKTSVELKKLERWRTWSLALSLFYIIILVLISQNFVYFVLSQCTGCLC
jgi:transposase-like protein